MSTAIIANLLFAAATQGWFMTRNRWWESPGSTAGDLHSVPSGFLDGHHPSALRQVAADQDHGGCRAGARRCWSEGLDEGEDINGKKVAKGVLLPLGVQAPALQRLNAVGLSLMASGDQVDILGVKFGSRAAKLGIEQGFVITALEVATERPDKECSIFLPFC